mmetsp:Transcript_15861/g.30385  ORF Transcript_15861/g.30385 Transcript_15861/m.30385 type:complete len:435 (+) Transcript_15861:160-1464(+)
MSSMTTLQFRPRGATHTRARLPSTTYGDIHAHPHVGRVSSMLRTSRRLHSTFGQTIVHSLGNKETKTYVSRAAVREEASVNDVSLSNQSQLENIEPTVRNSLDSASVKPIITNTEASPPPPPEEQGLGSFKALALLNLAAMLFGSTTVVISSVTEAGLQPSLLTVLRFAIAASVFLPQASQGLSEPVLRRNGAELSFWLFAGYLCQAVGLSTTTAARGAFTLAFTVLTVPLLVGTTGKKIPASNWVAGLVALVGVGLLTTSGGSFCAGDAWCIAAAVLFGVHKFRTERLTRETEGSLNLTAVQLLFMVGYASVWVGADFAREVVVNGATLPSAVEMVGYARDLPWLELGYMGLLTTAAPLLIEVSALKEVSAELAALIYTTEPLWGASFAWVLAGDRWGAKGWVGAALIMGSSLVAQRLNSGEDSETGQSPSKQ